MENLELSLFGSFMAKLNGESINGFRTQKVAALLILLAAEPDSAHRRETLMTLLWPGMPGSSGRSNLRQVLYHLRQAIPDFEDGDSAIPQLIANRHTIRLNPGAPVRIDTREFSALLEQVRAHDHLDLPGCLQCRDDLQAAAALYRGPFLADFYLDDSNEFEAWAETTRQVYRRKALDALEILAAIALRAQAYPDARNYAERQLEIDNLHESAYQQLMEILARSGGRNEALSIYEECRRLLMEELGMAPAARTTRLYEQILAGDLQFDLPPAQGVRGYELKEEIGSGTHGVIHRAVQPAIGREVAVKIIHRQYANDPAFIRRFEAEAQTIARLEHPHIVPLYDYWRGPEGAYLVMRLLRGGSLLAALESGSWPLDRTRGLLDQIAPALASAHAHGIVHRDIKPTNILFDESGNAYLSDFGIAKDLLDSTQLAAEGSLLGSPDYMSPEQLQEAPVSPQSDIYSLGAVLYEMLTGELPFADVPLVTLIQSHLSAPFPLVRDCVPDLPAQVDDVLQQATAKDPSDRYPDVLSLAEAFRQASQGRTSRPAAVRAIPTAEAPNPYKGLRAFQEADAADFFGREALTSQLVEGLNARRFLAVVGPSGSGKSSVVKAGVIPALRQGAIPGSDQWFVAEMVPGSHPLEELELALWPVAVDPPPSLVAPMERDTRGMLRTIRRILPREEGAQLLLVIDQFEELWSMADGPRRRRFLDGLLAAINAPNSPLRVIVTLRADFYDRPLGYQPLAEEFKENTILVTPLDRDELSWAIQEPARRVEVEFDDRVLAGLVADIEGQPGTLPLLQYALTELFDRRRDGRITRQSYDEIGGVLGAVANRAEEIYTDLPPAGQAAARQLFLRLITVGDSAGETGASPDTRRRALRSELEALAPAGEGSSMEEGETAIFRVIDRYGAARLLTFDHDPLTRLPTVEVAHEALITEWPRLRRWLNESRGDLRLHRLLAATVAEWLEAKRDGGYLLQGPRLVQYEVWSAETRLALTAEEQTFIAASTAARREQEAQEAARRQRELETAKQLAETERRRAEEQTRAADRLRRRAFYLMGALVAAGILAVAALAFARQSGINEQIALTQEAAAVAEAELRATAQAVAVTEAEQRATAQAVAVTEAEQRATAQAVAEEERAEAENQARLAFSRELAAASQNELDSDPERGILLALEALSAAHTVQAENVLHEAIQASRLRRTFNAGEQLWGVAFSPDGRTIATGDRQGRVMIWDPITGDLLRSIERHEGYVNEVAFNSDGTLLASAGDDNARVWDPATGQELFTMEGHTNFVIDIDFSSDDRRLVTSSFDGTARLWDVEASLAAGAGRELHTLAGHTDRLWRVNFSADGSRVGTASQDGTARVWDVESGEEVLQLQVLDPSEGGAGLESTVFSPDGSRLFIVGGTQGKVEMSFWDAQTGERLYDLVGHGGSIQNAKFSPDGSLVATASVDGTAKIWDATGGSREALITLAGHTSWVNSLAFSPDGKFLVTASRDGTARLWDISTSGAEELPTLQGHSDWIRSVKFSPDGGRLATASNDHTIQVWDAATGENQMTLTGHGARVNDVDFSPDGRLLASVGEDNLARLWDTASGAELRVLRGHTEIRYEWDWSGIIDVDFRPDGTVLATAGVDGQMKLWDVETGQELRSLSGHPDDRAVLAIDFSPDGRLLATATDQPILVKIWDVVSGRELASLEGDQNGRVFAVEFSPDGRSLAFGDNLGRLEVWQVPAGLDGSGSESLAEVFIHPSAHNTEIEEISFSADGRFLVTASADSAVRVWDAATGELLLNLNHPAGVKSAVFSPDGKVIATAGNDGLARLFVWELDDLIALAKIRVTRSLTSAECQQYLHLEQCPE